MYPPLLATGRPVFRLKKNIFRALQFAEALFAITGGDGQMLDSLLSADASGHRGTEREPPEAVCEYKKESIK